MITGVLFVIALDFGNLDVTLTTIQDKQVTQLSFIDVRGFEFLVAGFSTGEIVIWGLGHSHHGHIVTTDSKHGVYSLLSNEELVFMRADGSEFVTAYIGIDLISRKSRSALPKDVKSNVISLVFFEDGAFCIVGLSNKSTVAIDVDSGQIFHKTEKIATAPLKCWPGKQWDNEMGSIYYFTFGRRDDTQCVKYFSERKGFHNLDIKKSEAGYEIMPNNELLKGFKYKPWASFEQSRYVESRRNQEIIRIGWPNHLFSYDIGVSVNYNSKTKALRYWTPGIRGLVNERRVKLGSKVTAVTVNSLFKKVAIGTSGGEIHIYQTPSLRHYHSFSNFKADRVNLNLRLYGKDLYSKEKLISLENISFASKDKMIVDGKGVGLIDFRNTQVDMISNDMRLLDASAQHGIITLSSGKRFVYFPLDGWKQEINLGRKAVHDVSLSSNGKLALAHYGKGLTSLWNLRTEKQLASTPSDEVFDIFAAKISPEGGYIARAGDLIDMWSVVTGDKIWEKHYVSNLIEFSPDQRLLAVLGSQDEEVAVIEVTSGKMLYKTKFKGDTPVTLCFSTNGKELSVGYSNGKVNMFNSQTGELKKTFHTNQGSIKKVLYAPHKDILFTGDNESLIKIWNSKTCSLLGYLFILSDLNWISWTQDGRFETSLPDPSLVRINKRSTVGEDLGKHTKGLMHDILNKHYGDSPVENEGFNTKESSISYTNDIGYVLEVSHTKAFTESFKVFHNGLELKSEVRYSENKILIKSPLKPGENNFLILFLDKENNTIRSFEKKIIFNNTKGGISSLNIKPVSLGNKGKKYAVVIGVSDYLNLDSKPNFSNMSDLRFANKDAEAFADLLLNDHRLGGDWEVDLLTEKEATSVAIDTTLTKVF